MVNGPQGLENSVPAVWEATHPELAILRLHGRNQEVWNQLLGSPTTKATNVRKTTFGCAGSGCLGPVLAAAIQQNMATRTFSMNSRLAANYIFETSARQVLLNACSQPHRVRPAWSPPRSDPRKLHSPQRVPG